MQPTGRPRWTPDVPCSRGLHLRKRHTLLSEVRSCSRQTYPRSNSKREHARNVLLVLLSQARREHGIRRAANSFSTPLLPAFCSAIVTNGPFQGDSGLTLALCRSTEKVYVSTPVDVFAPFFDAAMLDDQRCHRDQSKRLNALLQSALFQINAQFRGVGNVHDEYAFCSTSKSKNTARPSQCDRKRTDHRR